MERTARLIVPSDLKVGNSAFSSVARTSLSQSDPCCPSTEMTESLREYLPDEFTLIAKDRNSVRGNWCITQERLLSVAMQHSLTGGKHHEVIQLTWEAQSLWDENYLLLPTSFASCHHCIQVPIVGISYKARIGWMFDEGYFIPILTSNWSNCHKDFSQSFPGN